MNFHFLKYKLSEFSSLDETTKKAVLLNSVRLTETFLDWDYLKSVLSPERYEQMRAQEKAFITENFSSRDDIDDETMTRFISSKFNRAKFIMNLKKNFGLMRFDYEDMAEEKVIFNVDISEVDLEKLLAETQRVMQEHRDFNSFYDGNLITGEEIKELLDLTLQTIQRERTVKGNNVVNCLKPADIETATLGIHGFSEMAATIAREETTKDEKKQGELGD